MRRALLWIIGVASALIGLATLAFGIMIWSSGGIGHAGMGLELFILCAFWAVVAGVIAWVSIYYARKPRTAKGGGADAA